MELVAANLAGPPLGIDPVGILRALAGDVAGAVADEADCISQSPVDQWLRTLFEVVAVLACEPDTCEQLLFGVLQKP
jgi:hypothetical protein